MFPKLKILAWVFVVLIVIAAFVPSTAVFLGVGFLMFAGAAVGVVNYKNPKHWLSACIAYLLIFGGIMIYLKRDNNVNPLGYDSNCIVVEKGISPPLPVNPEGWHWYIQTDTGRNNHPEWPNEIYYKGDLPPQYVNEYARPENK